MKILLEMPSRSEATILKRENERISVAPRFATANGQRTIFYFTVSGSKGAERRFVLNVNGKDGNLSIHDVSADVETRFDAMETASALPSSSEQTEE